MPARAGGRDDRVSTRGPWSGGKMVAVEVVLRGVWHLHGLAGLAIATRGQASCGGHSLNEGRAGEDARTLARHRLELQPGNGSRIRTAALEPVTHHRAAAVALPG